MLAKKRNYFLDLCAFLARDVRAVRLLAFVVRFCMVNPPKRFFIIQARWPKYPHLLDNSLIVIFLITMSIIKFNY